MAACFSGSNQLPFTQQRMCCSFYLIHAMPQPYPFCCTTGCMPYEQCEARWKLHHDATSNQHGSILDFTKSPKQKKPEIDHFVDNIQRDLHTHHYDSSAKLPKSAVKLQSAADDSYPAGYTDNVCSYPQAIEGDIKEPNDQPNSPRVLMSPFIYQPTIGKTDVRAVHLRLQSHSSRQPAPSLLEDTRSETSLRGQSNVSRWGPSDDKTGLSRSLNDGGKAVSTLRAEGKSNQEESERKHNTGKRCPASIYPPKPSHSEPCRRKPTMLTDLDGRDGEIEEAVRLKGQDPVYGWLTEGIARSQVDSQLIKTSGDFDFSRACSDEPSATTNSQKPFNATQIIPSKF